MVPDITLNLGAAGAGDQQGLQAVTKTLHLVLKFFLSDFEFKREKLRK